MPINDAILIVLVSVLGGGILGPVVLVIWNKVFNKNKDSADLATTALAIANQAAGELREAREQIASLEEDAKEAKQDRILLHEILRGARILIIQLEEAEMIPRWRIPTEYAKNDIPTQPDGNNFHRRGGLSMRRK